MTNLEKAGATVRAGVTACISVLGIIALGIDSTEGATPEAWSAHEKEVVTACVKASDLGNAKPGGQVIEFDDRVGFTAVVIVGRYPQPHMKNRRGRVLCLFDRRTRTAYVSEADLLLTGSAP